MDYISSIINYLFEIIRSLGYFGIMLGLMVEVIPSEIVLAYGGFLVSSGHINFLVRSCLEPLAECWHNCLFTGLDAMVADRYWISTENTYSSKKPCRPRRSLV